MDTTTLGLVTAIVTASMTLTAIVVKQFVAFFLKYMGETLKLKDAQAADATAMFIRFLTEKDTHNLQERLAWVDGLREHTELSKSTYTELNRLAASHEKFLEHLVSIEKKLQEMVDLQKQAAGSVVSNGLS